MFSTCEPNPCTQPAGACCFPDGTCTYVPQAECTATWLGLSTDCDPNPCPPPPPTGACCFPDGSCQVLTQAECEQDQGVYQGDNVPCTPELCPPPVPTERTSWGQIKNLYR
jgi:hypothetical protein